MKQETISELNFRLRELAKQSKDTSKVFRYLGNGINKLVKNG